MQHNHLGAVKKALDSLSSSTSTSASASVWEWVTDEDQHMSLSRTLYVKSHVIDSLLSQVRGALKFGSDKCVYLSNTVRLYLNDERNTAFVGFPVDATVSPFALEVIRRVDSVLSQFGLPKFYDDPDPHVSIAYTTDVETVNRLRHKSGNDIGYINLTELEVDQFRIDLGRIHIKIGNQIHLV